MAEKKVAVFNPEERTWVQWCVFQLDLLLKTDTLIHSCWGCWLIVAHGCIPLWELPLRERIASFKVILSPSMSGGYRMYKVLAFYLNVGDNSERPYSSQDPNRIIWGLSVPHYTIRQTSCIHMSISHSVSRIPSKPTGLPILQLHLQSTYPVDGLFQPYVISLGRGWRWAVLLLFWKDSLSKCKVFSLFWGSLKLPRLYYPKYLSWDVSGGAPHKKRYQTSIQYSEVRTVGNAFDSKTLFLKKNLRN